MNRLLSCPLLFCGLLLCGCLDYPPLSVCYPVTLSQGQKAAFCDTFSKPAGTGGRSGALDGLVWAVTRSTSSNNPGQQLAYGWASVRRSACGTSEVVLPSRDVAICNGQLVESVNDDGTSTVWAAAPRQPFDIANRTGSIVFDVSDDSQGNTAAWPAVVYADQPVSGYTSMAGLQNVARNSLGLTLAAQCAPAGCGPNGPRGFPPGGLPPCVSVDSMFMTSDYAESAVPFTQLGCVLEPTSPGQLNHFEIRVSATLVQVWATDPGGSSLREIAEADNVQVPLTRGYIWLEDVHGGNAGSHTFIWDNVAFDGPVLPRDLGFDVADGTDPGAPTGDGLPTVNLGYLPPAAPAALSWPIPDVVGVEKASGALLTLTYFPMSASGIGFSFNGHPWHAPTWPYGVNGGAFLSQVLALPVPLSELVDGTNTVQLQSPAGGSVPVANISLVLQGAGGAPASPAP